MDKRVPFRADPLNWVAFGVTLFGFVLVAIFFYLRAITPSDGARMIATENVWQSDGVVVTPWEDEFGGLQRGDKVIAVGNELMLDLAQDAVATQSNPLREDYRFGDQLVYTVVRSGVRWDVLITLRPFPFDKWFAQNWLIVVACAGCLVITLIVFFRRPSDRTTRAMLLWLPGLWASNVMYSLGIQVGDFVFPLNVWWFMLTASSGFILILTAVVRFAFEYTRPPETVFSILRSSPTIILTYVLPFAFAFIFLLVAWLNEPNALRWLGRWRTATGIIAAVCIGLSLLIAIWSYMSTRDFVTRQKIRWIVYAGSLVGFMFLGLNVLPALTLRRTLTSLQWTSVLFFLFELAIAYAILRYRYLEVDFIINRTLVFGVISALLALVYFGGLVGLQAIVGPSHTSQQADVVIVVTTLIGIALFNPLRQVAQRFIDRVFYRNKYEATKRIAQFSAALRNDEYADMDRLTTDLLVLTGEVTRPKQVGLWLRDVTPASVDER